MGNCLVIQDRNVINIMRMDGEIMKLPPPLKVHEALNEFPPGRAVYDELLVDQHLELAADTAAGRPPVDQQGGVRVKLVISKQELKKMLSKEGMSLDDMVSLMHNKGSCDHGSKHVGSRGWRPALESIAEGSDF